MVDDALVGLLENGRGRWTLPDGDELWVLVNVYRWAPTRRQAWSMRRGRRHPTDQPLTGTFELDFHVATGSGAAVEGILGEMGLDGDPGCWVCEFGDLGELVAVLRELPGAIVWDDPELARRLDGDEG